jgi:hypothetical protein
MTINGPKVLPDINFNNYTHDYTEFQQKWSDLYFYDIVKHAQNSCMLRR